MKNDKLIPGLILVMIGAIFLLHNFHVIYFHWSNFWHLWPIIIVIAGVNLVFAHNRSPWATILKIAVVIGGFALLVFGNFSDRGRWWWPAYHYHYNSHDNDDNDDNGDNWSNDDDDDSDSTDSKGNMVKISGTSQFKQAYNAGIKVARLNISGGATTYRLSDTTNQLFKADTKEHFGNYELNTHNEDSVFVMDFNMKGHKGNWNWDDNDNKSNIVNMMLNPNPVWMIEIAAGATDLNFDLSKFKVRSLKLSGGAGSFKMKVGQPLEATNINVSSGAADVIIEIPQNAACQIESSTGLSSNTYDGFNKKDDGHYETQGFDAAKNKMFIHISGFAGDFKVHRY